MAIKGIKRAAIGGLAMILSPFLQYGCTSQPKEIKPYEKDITQLIIRMEDNPSELSPEFIKAYKNLLKDNNYEIGLKYFKERDCIKNIDKKKLSKSCPWMLDSKGDLTGPSQSLIGNYYKEQEENIKELLSNPRLWKM